MKHPFADQYLDLVSPDLLRWQRRQKFFPHQNDQEVVIRLIKPSWDAHLKSYIFVALAWTVFIGTTIAAFLFSDSTVSALTTSIIALLIAAPVDALASIRIINKQMCSIIITNNRVMHWHHQGFFGRSSDVINFDMLTDVSHESGGFFRSKIFRSGDMILRLISGDEHRFSHTADPVETAAFVSHLQQLYKGGGKSFDFSQYMQEQQRNDQQVEGKVRAFLQQWNKQYERFQ